MTDERRDPGVGAPPTLPPGGMRARAPEHSRPLHASRTALRAEDAAGFLPVLRRADFRNLWLAQCASQLAQNSIFVILLVVIFRVSGKASISAVAAVAFTLPGVLLSAPAGVFADRHDKRTLMLWTNVGRTLLMVLAGLSTLPSWLQGQAWPLLLLTLAFSSASQLFAPAEAASIPALVSRRQIQGATSLFMTTVILSIVLGSALGSVAVGLLGNAVPFYVAAGLFAVAALLIWRIGASLHAVPAGTAPQTDILRELRDGLSVLRGSPPLRWGMIQLGLAMIVVYTIYTLGPDFMNHLLGPQGSQQLYIVLVPATVGLVVTAGALGQHRIRLDRRTLMVGAFFTAGGCLVAMGVSAPLLQRWDITAPLVPLVVVLALAFGLALGAILIPAFTVLQEGTTEESRGRIFGGVFTVVNLAIAIPALVAGAIADALSVYVAATVVGLAVVGVGFAFRFVFWSRLALLESAAVTPARRAGGS